MGNGKSVSKGSKTEVWSILLQDQSYDVQVTFKKMKTVRLRVVAGGEIRMSAPLRTSKPWLEQFLREREDWILVNVEKMRQMARKNGSDADTILSGKSLTAAERKEALVYLIPMVEKWHPVVADHGIPMPRVTVRRMRSRYGSCSVGRGRITLAEFLIHVPKECAEYVVLHELTHFLYPNHGKEFYQFIETHMPDYRQREKQLKQVSKSMT